jgi:hypothetical protein
MSVTVTYSHAAPFIRRQIVSALGSAAEANTVRAQLWEKHVAEGLIEALSIIVNSTSTKDEPHGVAEVNTLGERALTATKEFLQDRWTTLGFDEED